MTLSAQDINSYSFEKKYWVIFPYISNDDFDSDGKWFFLKDSFLVFGEDKRIADVQKVSLKSEQNKLNTTIEITGINNLVLKLYFDKDCMFYDSVNQEFDLQIIELLDSNNKIFGFAENYGAGIPEVNNWQGKLYKKYYQNNQSKHKFNSIIKPKEEEITLGGAYQDGIIVQINSDSLSGLMISDEQSIFYNELTLNDAKNYIKNLNADGKSNWRLPSVDELAQIYSNMKYVNLNENYFDGYFISDSILIERGGKYVWGITWKGEKMTTVASQPCRFMPVQEFRKIIK